MGWDGAAGMLTPHLTQHARHAHMQCGVRTHVVTEVRSTNLDQMGRNRAERRGGRDDDE